MICPRCDRNIKIALVDYSALNAHLVDVAQAFEDRGDRLALQLAGANAALDKMHAANQSLRDKLKAANDRAADLHAQLREFKTARRGLVAVPRQMRKIA
jgi:septal ring factor EnvC (AmiA/AmiB activator)